MDEFLNHLKAQAGRMDQGQAQPRFGIVSSVDPQKMTARVTIQPEGTLSGWLPVASPWVGAGWGLVCPVSPGDQVMIIWQEGQAEHGVIVGRVWSDVTACPAAQPGEIWLVHRSGSFLKLTNDGSIVSAAPNWTHTGDLHVSGDVYDQHGALSSLRGHYNEHVHPPGESPPSPTD